MSASRSLCLRVQTANGRNLWLHTVMRLHGGGNFENSFGDFSSPQAMIMCTSHVIDEMSALFIRLQELETPTETVDGDGHQMIGLGICGRDDGIFNGVPLGLFEPAQPLKPTSMQTTSQREEDRMLVNQRLKRKICDRQLEQQYTDAVLPSKVSRMDNMLSMELSDPSMPLCSMPSPPMQPWDCNATQSITGSVGQAAFNYSTFGVNEMQDFGISATTFNFRTNDDITIPTRNFAPVPDSYITPSNSPVTMDNSSTEDVNLFGLDDLIKSHTDDHSFFGNSQPAQNVIQQKASLITSHPNSGRWNVGSLPELDLCSVASILGDSELPTPTSEVAPTISEFGPKADACRQQLSGGHVIIVNGSDKSVIFGQREAMSAPANQPQQLHLMTAAATMTRSEPGNCSGNGTAVDQPFDQQLICNLLALGGDFIQNVTLNMPDPVFTPYGADVFQPATVNQFQCLATSVFGEFHHFKLVFQTIVTAHLRYNNSSRLCIYVH
jgi:tetrahydromethanopterin S-methyltransferase subunit G